MPYSIQVHHKYPEASSEASVSDAFVLQKASQTRAPLPLAELSIPILQEGIPTIQVVPAPAQFGLSMPQSDALNNNEVQVSSQNLPALMKKRGRKPGSTSVKAMKAQIRNEAAEKIKGFNLKKK